MPDLSYARENTTLRMPVELKAELEKARVEDQPAASFNAYVLHLLQQALNIRNRGKA